MAIADVGDFVETVRHSCLLEPVQVDELTQLLARCLPEPRKLAGELIRREWLTPYQVNQLFQGKGKELSLGPYLLLERLGEGGMGQVFKARHRTMHRVVALKILHPRLVENETAVRRFLREVRAAGQLTHPNIVQAFDADQIDGRYYFAMEYIQGIDLAQLVKNQGPLKVSQACEYVRQAALGLQHAFERGMVHRDIKPANLLVSPKSAVRNPNTETANWKGSDFGIVKVLDMGLARLERQEDQPHSTELTQVGTVMGTPDFIAPEQARNSHSSDVRSDLYSLGCTLYFLLTGSPPFPVGTVTERLLHHQLDEPERVEEVRRRELLQRGANPRELRYLSSRVGNLVRRLMAKKPEDRPQTPAELAEIVAGLLVHNSSPALNRPALLEKTPSALPRKTPPTLPAARQAAARSSGQARRSHGSPAPPSEPATPTRTSAATSPVLSEGVDAGPIIQPRCRGKHRGGLVRILGKVILISGILLLGLALGKNFWQSHASTSSSFDSAGAPAKPQP